MAKLFRPTFMQRGCRIWGGLLLASGLVFSLVAARSVTAQERPAPLLKGGVEERSYKGIPTTGSFGRDECQELREFVELSRKALKSPEVTQSQAWRDTKDKAMRFHEGEVGFGLADAMGIKGHVLTECACIIASLAASLHGLWRIRNDPHEKTMYDDRSANVKEVLKGAQQSVERVEDCFKKGCETGRASDQSPCPPPTAAVTSGPLLFITPLGEPDPADLQRDLEALRLDLDQFWRGQFRRNGLLVYSSPDRLISCRKQEDCAYAPPTANDSKGAILYHPENVLQGWKRYGGVSLVFSMGHEFGHNVERQVAREYRDPESELFADRLAGAYLGHLHRQGIVANHRVSDASSEQERWRSPCPEDDVRAVRALLLGMGDPGLSLFFRGGIGHSLARGLGAPLFHGSGQERWAAFQDGYRNGIPPDLFRVPWKAR